jgi:hypothetical protein
MSGQSIDNQTRVSLVVERLGVGAVCADVVLRLIIAAVSGLSGGADGHAAERRRKETP